MFSLRKWKTALLGRRLEKVRERRISGADTGQEDKTFSALIEALREMKCSMVAYTAMGNFTEEDIHGMKPSAEPYRGEILLIYEYYCVNPQCNCRSVQLDLVPKSKSTNKPASFTFNFDTGAVDGVGIEEIHEEFRVLAEEFSRDTSESFRDIFRKHYREAKEFGAKLYNLALAYDNFRERAMVCYCDLYPDTEEWQFSYKNKWIIVTDDYCAQPNCNCHDVVLTFSRSDVGKRDIVEPLFAVRLKEGNRFEEEERDVGYDEMNRLMKAFQVEVPDLQQEVLRRLRKVKERGKVMAKEHISERQVQRVLGSLCSEPDDLQSSEPVIVKKKVGRNEPCPCGSGKKYKKCCGR